MGRFVLPASGSVYVDVDCIVYSVEKVKPFGSLLADLWRLAAAGRIRFLSIELTLLETLVRPIREGNQRLHQLLSAFLLTSKEVALIPIDTPILELAARVRAETGLKTPDAIHAATSLRHSCDPFITNDVDFTRIRDLKRVVLLRDSI